MNTELKLKELNCFQYSQDWFLLWLIVYHSITHDCRGVCSLLCCNNKARFTVISLLLPHSLSFCYSKHYTRRPLFSTLFVNKNYISCFIALEKLIYQPKNCLLTWIIIKFYEVIKEVGWLIFLNFNCTNYNLYHDSVKINCYPLLS